jgi:hypothetical protein
VNCTCIFGKANAITDGIFAISDGMKNGTFSARKNIFKQVKPI